MKIECYEVTYTLKTKHFTILINLENGKLVDFRIMGEINSLSIEGNQIDELQELLTEAKKLANS